MDDILAGLGAALCGALLGWAIAHKVVATECDKLNSFYVGSTVYSCNRK